MKKIVFSSSLLACALFSNNSFAANPTSGLYSCGGFEVGVSGLYARTNNADTEYAILDHQDIDLLLDFDLAPQGSIRSIDTDHTWLYEAHVGYIFPRMNSDLVLTYRSYNESESDFTEAARDSFVWMTNFPPTILDEFVDGPVGDQAIAAFARVNYDYHKWSLEYGHYLCGPCGFNVRLLVGIDYANIERKIRREYTDIELNNALDGGIVQTGIQHEKSDFSGCGPKIGFDAEYCLFQGLGLIGHFNTSFLIGDLDYNFFANAINADGDLVDPLAESFVDNSFKDHVVPNVNVKVGVDYTWRFCNPSHSSLVFEVGYQVDHYWKAFRSINFVAEDDDATGIFTKNDTNFYIQGPYASLTIVI